MEISTIISMVLIILGIPGNIFSVYVICTSRKFVKDMLDYILGNIAIAHIIFLLMNLLNIISAVEFHLPAFTCPIIHYLRTASFLLPIFAYFVLSIEKAAEYFHTPTHTKLFTDRKPIIYSFLLWTIALVFSLPYFLDFRVELDPNKAPVCLNPRYNTKFWKNFINIQLIAGTAIPLLLSGTIFELMIFRLALYNIYSNQTLQTTDSPAIHRGIHVLMKVRKVLMALLGASVISILLAYLPAAYSMTAIYYGIEVPVWLERASSVLMLITTSCSTYLFVRFALDYQSRTKEVTAHILNGVKSMFRRLWMCNVTKVQQTEHVTPQLESIAIQTISNLVHTSTNTEISMEHFRKYAETSV
ncbi:7 transmembrane receptor (rhodopsin family) domain-containing protein [Ditylenchus destructor]|nr:7 transmembrane receptor (rhodopsin family) domain-containing protein [Ditylenchus destructor]